MIDLEDFFKDYLIILRADKYVKNIELKIEEEQNTGIIYPLCLFYYHPFQLDKHFIKFEIVFYEEHMLLYPRTYPFFIKQYDIIEYKNVKLDLNKELKNVNKVAIDSIFDYYDNPQDYIKKVLSEHVLIEQNLIEYIKSKTSINKFNL